MSNAILSCQGVSKIFRKGGETLEVLNDINFNIFDQEIVAIVGASGVGKSTLLHILGALDKPTKGKIFYGNTDTSILSERKLSLFRNQTVGFVFQFHYLIAECTACENVMLPPLIAGTARHSALQMAKDVLARVGLEKRFHHKPGELSGGEQQRVAIARALVMNPKIVLADEPTGNLDPKTAWQIFDLFVSVNDQHRTPIVIVTHNERLVSEKIERVLRIESRKITECVNRKDVSDLSKNLNPGRC